MSVSIVLRCSSHTSFPLKFRLTFSNSNSPTNTVLSSNSLYCTREAFYSFSVHFRFPLFANHIHIKTFSLSSLFSSCVLSPLIESSTRSLDKYSIKQSANSLPFLSSSIICSGAHRSTVSTRGTLNAPKLKSKNHSEQKFSRFPLFTILLNIFISHILKRFFPKLLFKIMIVLFVQ